MNLPVTPRVQEGVGLRPFWSVMIPTYRPNERYLLQALESVLQQATDPEQMQIEVVDDCSPEMDVAALVKGIAGERVKISQTPGNLGLAGCWNACIERARGEWVHILHQDDLVLPGFYERLGTLAMTSPEAGMIVCRFAVIDGDDHWRGLSVLERGSPGLLENWLERVTSGHFVECPAVAVRKFVYNALGGFSCELNFALDLEMWIRIAAHYPVAYEPAILACYRRHAGNETARLERMGGTMMDVARVFRICRTYLPPGSAERLITRGREYWAEVTLMVAESAYAKDHLDACALQLQAARMLCNYGKCRKRRLRLAAKAAFKLAMGPRLLAAIRRWRSRE